MMKIILPLFFLLFNFLHAQTNYNQLANWYYHPDKAINFIESYDLDIAVINKNLGIDSVIAIPNNAGINTGVDVFWVHPTELTNPPWFPTTIPIDSQNTPYIGSVILAQGALLAKYGRFFAPKYRQASPASFLGTTFTEQQRAEALLETYSDIRAAFLNYLNNHNNGNKIIIAGHSQGSFILAMLLREFFDNDPSLRDRLVTAALGGMGYVYAAPNTYDGGWWENIPICTLPNECGCVHYWRSYKETEDLPLPKTTFPSFNQVLVDSGKVFRTTDLSNDRLLQDSLYYGTSSVYLRYYITPDAAHNLGNGTNFIAFDSMYTARFKRESNVEIGLAVDVVPNPGDPRPNELASLQNPPIFSPGDLHVKDYHIYIWALLEQIDAKLNGCSAITPIDPIFQEGSLMVFPNPNAGTFRVRLDPAFIWEPGEKWTIVDILGREVLSLEMSSVEEEFRLDKRGVYFLRSKYGIQKIVVD